MWKKPEKPPAVLRSPWAATSIVPTKTSCEAAQLLRHQRFLAIETPRLPLTDCSHPESCACAYRKYRDRRDGPRRDDESSGIRRYIEPSKDRRARPGRRRSDHEPFP